MKKSLLLSLFVLCSISAFSQRDIPMEVLPSGHIVVSATVAGVPGKFIFDTGGGINVLTEQFFRKLPASKTLDGGLTAFRATGERLDLKLYEVGDIRLGDHRQANAVVASLAFNLGDFDGLISLPLMEGQPFTLDFEKKVLRLEPANVLQRLPANTCRIPLQFQQFREKATDIFAYFRVNDSLRLQFLLDSGAGKDVYRLNASLMDRLRIDRNDSTKVQRIARPSEVNAAFTSYIYKTRLPKLSVDACPAIQQTDLPVQFVDGLIYDGILWINWLGKQVTIDLPNKTMAVQR
ncbi:aspartyl protease family protein [Chitinophaga lutea]